jgi:hypothetical protein
VTEPPPEIPPWSPLADRARTLGDELAAAGATSTDTRPPDEPVDEERPGPDAGDAGRRSTRSGGRWWRLVAVLALAVMAVSLMAMVAVRDGHDMQSPSTTTVVRAPQPSTSEADPAAIGTLVSLGNGWTVSVGGPLTVATDEVLASAPDTPVAEGAALVLVDLEMSYTDGRADSESPFEGVDLSVVGDDGLAVTPSDDPCPAPAPALDQLSPLERGGVAAGRVCFTVPAEQTAGLRLVAEPSMAYGSQPSWFALEPQP